MNRNDAMGIELTHLRYFVAVAEELHFGRAAERLHISQPPLTQQIQRLEARIGCALLVRTSRKTELTAAGRAFYESAKTVLQETRRAVENARRLARGELGQLTIATPPSLMLAVLPPAILEFRRQFPGVNLRLREMATSAIFHAIESGFADLGLVRGPDIPQSIEKLATWHESLIAILPRSHAIARRHSFHLKMLAKEPFVFFPSALGPAFYGELLDHCRKAGFEPKIVQEATEWSSVIALVSAGLGVSIGPESVGGLLERTVAIRRLPKLRTEVHIIRSGKRDNPAMQRFVAVFASLSLRRS
jgi:DNA-binding transcriptional LysR family regulator